MHVKIPSLREGLDFLNKNLSYLFEVKSFFKFSFFSLYPFGELQVGKGTLLPVMFFG